MQKPIIIKRRYLPISLIVLVLLCLLFAFGWVNGLVSYKYEVQDTIFAGKPLDEHQQSIIGGILSCKIGLACSVVLLIIILVMNEFEPNFGGRLIYKSKG